MHTQSEDYETWTASFIVKYSSSVKETTVSHGSFIKTRNVCMKYRSMEENKPSKGTCQNTCEDDRRQKGRSESFHEYLGTRFVDGEPAVLKHRGQHIDAISHLAPGH
jgi:hypothetical protein